MKDKLYVVSYPIEGNGVPSAPIAERGAYQHHDRHGKHQKKQHHGGCLLYTSLLARIRTNSTPIVTWMVP